MKKHEIESDELRTRESAQLESLLLESLLEGLRSGELSLTGGERELSLHPGGAISFAPRGESVPDRERLRRSLEWRRQQLRIGRRPAAAAQGTEPPFDSDTNPDSDTDADGDAEQPPESEAVTQRMPDSSPPSSTH